jgi:hypothetical protein
MLFSDYPYDKDRYPSPILSEPAPLAFTVPSVGAEDGAYLRTTKLFRCIQWQARD